MPTIERRRTVDGPTAVAWDVITDHELYGSIAPNLESVEVIEGIDEELVRRCVDINGNEWTESCTRWDDGEAFAVEVDVSTSDFHRRLFHRFTGEWCLDEGDDGVRVTIRFHFEPRYGPIGRLITAYLEWRGPPIIDAILDRWAEEIADRAARGVGGGHEAEGPYALNR